MTAKPKPAKAKCKLANAKSLADQIAQRRGKRYPAHAFIAEHFPDYMEVLLDLDHVIREKPRRFNEKMHELFHIIALAVEMSNPVNQPHLKQHLKKGLQMGWKPEVSFGDLVQRMVEADLRSLEDKGWGSDIRGGLNQPPALGRLMGLDEEQIANAIGLCLSHALPLGILDAHREECSMAKNIRFGWVAYDAILACMLAGRGFTGPQRVVEGGAGIREVIAQGEMDLERLTDFSGWRMRDVRFKSMPANGPTASHVSATLALVQEHDLRPADIAAVRIVVALRESRHTTTPAKKYPRNAESADHSAHYANALAIKERAFGPSSIDPAKFTDPVVLDLIERITVEADASFHGYQAVSEIHTRDGRCLRKSVDLPHGLGRTAHTDAELEAKFREMAQPHMPERQIAQIFEACWSAEQLPDMGSLTRLMTFPRSD